MSYRQVLLLGGAALVLAACADATGPGTQMRRAGVEAAAKDKPSTTTTTTTTTSSTTSDGSCERTSYQVASGRTDSTCVGGDQ
jgi:ABC-type glycerol-3-phosphate transport system substrate-binding protein